MKKSLIGHLIVALLFIIAGVVLQIVFEGVKGNLFEFLLHCFALLIILLGGIANLIKYRKSINKKIYIIVFSSVLAVGAVISLVLFIANTYKRKLSRYDYVEPTRIEYYSGVTDTNRHALVLLPKDYDGNKKYPVLYILHGLGGNEYTWIKKKADIIIQNMEYKYGCKEMVVVFPNSNVNPMESTAGMDYLEKCVYYDKTEEDLINYLMPYIEENYSVLTGRENTAILGNSMGGRNTAYIAFEHQELFGYVGIFSAAGVVKTKNDFFPPLIEEFVLDEKYGDFNYLLVMVGREDFVCGDVSYDIDKRLNEAGIKHEFYDMLGTHQDSVWQDGLKTFCQNVFK